MGQINIQHLFTLDLSETVHLDKALESMREHRQFAEKDWETQRHLFSRMGGIAFEKEDYLEAQKYYALSIDIIETVRLNFSNSEMRSSFLEKAIHEYHMIVMTSLMLNGPWTALHYLEHLKSRVLGEMIADKSSSLLLDVEPSDSKTIPTTFMVYKSIKDFSHRWLGKTVLLFLFPMNELTIIVVVRQIRNEIEAHEVTSHYGVEKLMADVHKLEDLSHSGASEALDFFLDTTLKKLYTELFAPIEAYLPEQTERITFIPYSGFHLLPLHAMFTEDNGRREYLIDKYLVTYAPSVKILKHCELMERSPDGEVLVASANPRNDLRYSLHEAQAVAETFGTHVTHNSKRQDILHKGRDAHVFHYTGHGNGQALILHGDGHGSYEDVFEAADVFSSLDLPQAWLVTLSACETGKVKLGKTDEYIGLPSAFIHAGAATVISSLWCVSDHSTTLLMRKMYELIRGGRGKAESLREAQLWLRDLSTSDEHMQELIGPVPGMGDSPKDVSRFSRTHASAAIPSRKDLHKPYYWAGFICTGAP